MRSQRVAFYGNFGSGNLGNECTLQAIAEEVEYRWPGAELLCICTVPDDVQSRHQIRGVPATATNTSYLGEASQPRHWRGLSRAISRALRIAFRRIPLELVHWIRSFKIILASDVLIVPGTQIVSDYLCGPSGWPYDIFKWSTLAALCRVDLIFLSIGVGPIRHPLSRWFIKTSLRRARFRSYRDEESRRYLQEIGFRGDHDPVYPDLVFGLSLRPDGRDGSGADGRLIVGLGLKNLDGGLERQGTDAYRDYLATMAAFIAWLQGRGYAVRLLIGDLLYDTRPRSDLIELLHERKVVTDPPLLLVEQPLTVEQLVRQIEQTHVVVSPRFHNLVLALMLGKPVIALSDHAKLDSLLGGLGLEKYRVSLEDVRIESLVDCFTALEREMERLEAHIKGQTERCRRELQQQYEAVFVESARAI